MTLDQLTTEQRLIIARQESRALRQFAQVGRWPTCAPLGATSIGRGELRTDVAQVAAATHARQLRRTA